MERIILSSQFEVYKHTQKEKYVDVPVISELELAFYKIPWQTGYINQILDTGSQD
jgi:hypothetical protein